MESTEGDDEEGTVDREEPELGVTCETDDCVIELDTVPVVVPEPGGVNNEASEAGESNIEVTLPLLKNASPSS